MLKQSIFRLLLCLTVTPSVTEVCCECTECTESTENTEGTYCTGSGLGGVPRGGSEDSSADPAMVRGEEGLIREACCAHLPILDHSLHPRSNAVDSRTL